MRKAVAALLLLVLAGCGGPGIGEQASQALSPQVASIREAAEAGEVETAAQRLALLKFTALQLHEEGTLDQAGLERVVASADDVAAFLIAESAPMLPEGELRVPIEDLNPPARQAGTAGGRDGDDGEKGEEGDDGERGDKGANGPKGNKGNERDD